MSKNSLWQEYKVAAVPAGMTLELYVKDVLHISARQRQRLFFSKGVCLNGRATHSQHLVKEGDCVAVRQLVDTSYGVTPAQGTVEVLYEDNEVLVVNKPVGMLVHPAGETHTGTLANYVAGYFQQQGLVVTVRALHRLDRDTTGCVLFAKSAPVQRALEQELHQGEVHRRYEALVVGQAEELLRLYPEGRIALPIGRDPLRPNRRRVTPKGEPAVTRFKLLATVGRQLLVELELETGRTHQIRVHFSHSGFPVLGDRMYGKASRLIKRQALHAKYLEFKHPVTGQLVQVTAPRPQDMAAVVAQLSGERAGEQA